MIMTFKINVEEIAMGKICEIKLGEPIVIYVRFVVDGKLYEKGVSL